MNARNALTFHLHKARQAAIEILRESEEGCLSGADSELRCNVYRAAFSTADMPCDILDDLTDHLIAIIS